MNRADTDRLLNIAKAAGDAILEIYAQDFEIFEKADQSPLTEADKKANEIIMEELEKYFPEIPVISEENKAIDYNKRKNWTKCWMVDPLDGTKEFIKKNGEFTVNIALIENGKPVFGVVYVPVQEKFYYNFDGKAWMRENGKDKALKAGKHYTQLDEIKVIASRSHLSDAVKDFVVNLEKQGKKVEFIAAGSSLKLCLVAEGKADVYPRLGPTMEWDTAAADAVARAAGRQVLHHQTKEALQYNKEDLLNPWFFVE
ncbi:MAG: 3'(2'),5'-bisphosphate nucleotidase CysQ [Chitinophagales bacterium]